MQVRGMLGSVLRLVSLCRVEAVQLPARSVHVAVRERFVEVRHLRYNTSASATHHIHLFKELLPCEFVVLCIAKFLARPFIPQNVRGSNREEKEENFQKLLGQKLFLK
jgi:hypothetical protein